jgi:hypothetical protein
MAHDLDNIPHHVTAGASGNSAEQMSNGRADFRLGIAGTPKSQSKWSGTTAPPLALERPYKD